MLDVIGNISNLNYAILHGWRGLPQQLPSDLDIAIAPDDLAGLEVQLMKPRAARLVNLLQHESTCYYFVLALWEDGRPRFVPVDAAADYRRDGRVWFSSGELLAGRRRWKDLWVAAPEVEFQYLLVKKILKGSVLERTAGRLRDLAQVLGDQAEGLAIKLLGEPLGRHSIRWIRAGEWQEFQKHIPALQKMLKAQKLRRDPLSPLRYWLDEIKRIWRRWRYPTGLFVVVLGPDGAGKSTLIEHLERDIARAFRRTARFHLTPGRLGRGSSTGLVSDPHGKPPRSWFASLLKLGYYLVDYTLGYCLKVRPALARSTLVLLDRYYDDLLVDPKRYRYGGPLWTARWLRRFIPRPDLWLILDVPEEELLRRKQEVPLEELRRQREGYRRLAAELSNAALFDGSGAPEEIARQAEEAILEYMHERYLSRRSLWFPNSRAEEEREYLTQALRAQSSEEGKPFLHLPLPDGRSYLLPPTSRKASASGLSLYAPQKPMAKLLKSVLQAGLGTGLARCWLPVVNLDLRGLEEHLAQIFGRLDLSLAVSLGTPGIHRKPMVLVMTHEGMVLGYVKVGWNEETRRLVENEVLTLQRLKAKDLPFLVPRLLFAGKWQGRFICVQSPPAGTKPAPSYLAPIYLQALGGLAGLGVKWSRLEESQFWQNIERQCEQVTSSYWRSFLKREIELVSEAWQDREAPFHLAHGDFAPWNALVVDGRLCLFDWEYSDELPAGYDLFHFLVQTMKLVEKRSPKEITDILFRRFREISPAYYRKYIAIQDDPFSRLFLLCHLHRLSTYLATSQLSFGDNYDLAIMAKAMEEAK